MYVSITDGVASMDLKIRETMLLLSRKKWLLEQGDIIVKENRYIQGADRKVLVQLMGRRGAL